MPEGYSAYLNGQRIFTVSDLVRLVWNSKNGAVSFPDGGAGAQVLFKAARPIPAATAISFTGDAKLVDMFQKAGVDLSDETGWSYNRARGKPVAASFTTTSPALRATSAEFAVDGWTISGLPANGPGGQARPGYVAPNTIWGACGTITACGNGTSASQVWFEVDLLQPRKIDTVKLCFFNDKSDNPQQNNSNNTYRHPTAYTIQYHDGSDWVDVPDQSRTPQTSQANYNTVNFPQLAAQRVRVLMTRQGNFGVGLKEIQVFNTTPTSFTNLRQLVEQFYADGQVTGEGRTRLLQKISQAEKELARNSPDKPVRNLQQFVDDTAVHEQYVPGQAARWALVDEAEQLIAQLGGTPTTP